MLKFWVLGSFALLCVGEAWVFLTVSDWLGSGWVLVWILISFVLGLVILRFEGVRLLFRVHRQLQAGNLPTLELLGGTMILLSALLLVIPGFVTDGLGIVLLLPPSRGLMIAAITRALAARFGHEVWESHHRPQPGEVIEIEAEPPGETPPA